MRHLPIIDKICNVFAVGYETGNYFFFFLGRAKKIFLLALLEIFQKSSSLSDLLQMLQLIFSQFSV